METIYMLVNNKSWNGPISGTFTPGKKSMLIFLSGSAWAGAPGLIGVELRLNGVKILQASVFTNETSSHKALIPVSVLYENPFDDYVNYEIVPLGGTILDYNDYFNLTVTVFQ